MTAPLTPDEWAALWPAEQADAARAAAPATCDEADALALRAAAPDAATAAAWWATRVRPAGGGAGGWPLLEDGGPRTRWDAYCAAVAADLERQGAAAGTVFGSCRRCGSTRLSVVNRQTRRADEGMTEIRTCQDCGHATRVNA